MRSRSAGWTAAFSRARSRRCGSRSRWSRAASSGTTPPNSRCSSTWEWMTLARIRRPSSTTATEVSSQLVSMPSVSDLLSTPLTLTLSPKGRGESVSLGEEVAAEAADFGSHPVLAKHDVVGAGARRQLPVVGVAGPGSCEDLALDLLDRVDVGLPHQLQDELLPELDHYFLEAENVCMYSISRLP